MASRGHTIKLEFMVENDLNQKETRDLFQQLLGAPQYTRNIGDVSPGQESTPLRDVLKQYGLLPLTESGTYAHLGDASYNAEKWARIQETRNGVDGKKKAEAFFAT
jgi:hypothetical protein